MALRPSQKTELLKLVSNQLLETEQEIHTTAERLHSIQEHMGPTIAHQPGEDGTSSHDRDLAMSQLLRYKDRKSILSSVQIQLQSGTYSGHCQGCKKPIDFERLKIVPETKLCFTCATRR